jgi:hypothetical protein
MSDTKHFYIINIMFIMSISLKCFQNKEVQCRTKVTFLLTAENLLRKYEI